MHLHNAKQLREAKLLIEFREAELFRETVMRAGAIN